jgi:glycosyltransferase involved in cell wall biosynthesis
MVGGTIVYMSTARKPKVAIVHDWLTTMGGAEEVVLALAEAFPGAPIYTSTYVPEKVPRFEKYDVRTTYLQRLPKPLKKLHKFLPTMRVKAFQKLDLSEYDIIISSSSAEAKQVRKTREDQIHICYCHTPIRYYWSHYEQYRKDPGFGKLNWLIRMLMPLFVPRMRQADYEAAQKVDYFIANSEAVRERIKEYYNRSSTVIHPPVNTRRFSPSRDRGTHFVTVGRQVPYKRHDLAVQACTELGIPLEVFGNGPEHDKLKRLAGPTIRFRTDRFGDASDDELNRSLATARGFIYCAEEDFGIVQAEALAAGTPVIAYGKAGTLDIINSEELGELFEEQTVDHVIEAIQRAQARQFYPSKLARAAKRFDKGLFITKMQKVVASVYK